MEDTISRIMEIEKQCADEVEQAEEAYRRKVEEHRKTVEERKAEESARIVDEGKDRLARAIEEAQKNAGEALHAAEVEMVRLDQDPSLEREIQEKIVSLLLTS
ncbi:MAG: hypothetical protein JXI32_03955 [Deltaproteobacteria bacterium]|nr:hypothetical protein [Deltaproteobacteria bacterium]